MIPLPAPPHLPGWRPGFRLDVSAWLDPAAPAGGPAFRTGRTRGELSAAGAPGDEPALVRLPLPSAGAVLVWHDGLAAGEPGQPPAFLAAVVAPGLLVADGLAAPAVLFSPRLEPVAIGRARVLDLGVHRVALAADPARPRRAVVLLSPEDAPAAAARAEAALEADPGAWFAAGRAARARLDVLPATRETPAALAGFEALAGALRPATGVFDGRWCDTGGGRADFSHLPALLAAWAEWDPAAAGDLLRSALRLVQPDGRLPGWVDPAAGEMSAHAAPPGLVCSAADFFRAAPDPALAAAALPILSAHLGWWLARSDPARRGAPVWPGAACSPVPELFDPSVASAGLAALLLRELAGLAALAAATPDPARDDRWIQVERERLADVLEHHFWNAAGGVFADRRVGGDFIRRPLATDWLAAGAPEVPPALRERALRNFGGAGTPLAEEGVRAWVPWPGDDTPPPAPLALQSMVLRALETDPGSRRGARAAAAVRRRLARLADEHAALPADLRAPPDAPVWHPAAGGLLLRLVSSGAGAAEARPLSPALRWLERRRGRIGLGLAAAAVLALLAAVLPATFRPASESPSALAALAGHARDHHNRGEFAEAAALYDRLVAAEPSVAEHRFRRGNTRFRAGDFALAEPDYREAVRLRPDWIEPRWNLAQTLHRRGRGAEALAQFRDLRALPAPRDRPGFTRRLDDAIALLEAGAGAAPPAGP